jgi:hypothetical protein
MGRGITVFKARDAISGDDREILDCVELFDRAAFVVQHPLAVSAAGPSIATHCRNGSARGARTAPASCRRKPDSLVRLIPQERGYG